MMLVIQTQDYENYAAHQGFTGEFYWKAKGGSEFKITGIPQGADLDEIVELARAEIEEDTPYFQTQIISYGLESDDYLSWFEKSQLDYDGEIQFPEPTIEYSELNARYTDPADYAERSADLDAVYYGA
jgi:hypothetical protein